MVSAMMGRLVWTHTFVDSKDDHLYGNLFTILVGPPGAGKTKAVVEARKILTSLGVNIGPDDTNGEALHEVLKVTEDNQDSSPGTIALFLDEFDSLMHKGMSASAKRLLNHLYDCRTEEMARFTYSHGDQELRDLCLTLCAGCTPAHLSSFFTPLEWQEGLPSRLLLIYGEKPPFKTNYSRGSMENLLLEAEETMRFIGMTTRVSWTKDAMGEYVKWCEQYWSAKSPHHLMGGYIARRPLHLAKLAFVLAVARRSSLITVDDWQRSLSAIMDTERDLPKCLALSGGNETKDIEGFVREWIKSRPVAAEWEIRRLVGNRVSHYMINSVIEELVAQKIIVPASPTLAPNRLFKRGEE